MLAVLQIVFGAWLGPSLLASVPTDLVEFTTGHRTNGPTLAGRLMSDGRPVARLGHLLVLFDQLHTVWMIRDALPVVLTTTQAVFTTVHDDAIVTFTL